MIWMLVILIYGLMSFSGIALAEEAQTIEVTSGIGLLLLKLLGADFENWLAALVALSVALNRVSAGVGLISGKLEEAAGKSEAQWDNKAAKGAAKAGKYIGRAGSYVAWLLGIFGVGSVPKSVKVEPKLKFLRKAPKK